MTVDHIRELSVSIHLISLLVQGEDGGSVMIKFGMTQERFALLNSGQMMLCLLDNATSLYFPDMFCSISLFRLYDVIRC